MLIVSACWWGFYSCMDDRKDKMLMVKVVFLWGGKSIIGSHGDEKQGIFTELNVVSVGTIEKEIQPRCMCGLLSYLLVYFIQTLTHNSV